MPLFKTSNPALGTKTFQDAAARYGGAIDAANRMTLNGTVNRTGILLICAFATAAYTWRAFMQTHDPADVTGLLMVGVFGGFITAMITIFKQTWAPITAPIYALMEGLFLGGISAFLEMRYPGIAIQAVGLTFGTLLTMLVLYSSGLIKVTNKLRIGIIAATGGIALFYLMEIILGFFGIQFVSINGSGVDRHWLQPLRLRHRSVEPCARFRFHRAGRERRRAEVHGVVRRLRHHGHARVALS